MGFLTLYIAKIEMFYYVFKICNNDESLTLVCILHLSISSNIVCQSPPYIKLLLSSTLQVINVVAYII